MLSQHQRAGLQVDGELVRSREMGRRKKGRLLEAVMKEAELPALTQHSQEAEMQLALV